MSTYVVAIDPGGTTGAAAMYFGDDTFEVLNTTQWDDPNNVWKRVYDYALQWCGRAEEDDAEFVLICESFEVRPDVIHPDETPKYIIKDLERYVEPDYPIRYQMASYAKGGVHPTKGGQKDRLHAFGVYQKGQRHANDALRHCITYAIDQLNHRPTIIKGWGLPGRK